MKSLAALLDRKKRSNTLVPSPPTLSLPLPTSAAAQERAFPPSNARHAPASDFLHPPVPHRATSNPDLPRCPHLHEPTTPPRRQSPVQSIAYHNDSDDDTLADPFAASPSTKLKPRLPPTSLRPPPSYTATRRGSTPNLHTPPVPHSAFQTKEPARGPGADRNADVAQGIPSQTSSRTGADSNESGSAPVYDVTAKERRLRERRSFSNFFRPQATVPTAPVPQAAPLPGRVPERKTSFFRRGRSGSTPAATREIEQAHTPRRLSAMPAPTPSRSQTTATTQLRHVDGYTAPITPKTVDSLNETSPDSWVRVGGVSHDQSSPGSPTNARRRALSVPSARPAKFAEPPLPVLPARFVSSTEPNRSIAPRTGAEQKLTILQPKLPLTNQRVGLGHSTHGPKSASVSISSSHDARCGPLESNLRRRPSLKHFKRPSASVSEGGHGTDSSSLGKVVRKSALKRSSAQTRLGAHIRQESRVTAPADTPLAASTPQLPMSASESSLKRLVVEVVVDRHIDPVARVPSSPYTSNTSTNGLQTPSSLGNSNSVGGLSKGLAASDSRTLPVLDNIWGSFKSETAFGSLPSSPNESVLARNRIINSPGSVSRRRIDESPDSPESLRSPLRRRPWNLSLLPPGSPPVLKLPPVPADQSPTLALPLGSVSRRKISRNPSKHGILLTPPISPTEEIEGMQGLGVVLSTSASDNSLLASSYDSSELSSAGSQDLPRLTRSASSPVTRSPPSPGQGTGLDTINRSWLSHVDLPRSRSGSSSSVSQSSSQCTPVPGAPISLPASTIDQALSYLGISNGVAALGPSAPLVSRGGHVETPGRPAQSSDLLPCDVPIPCAHVDDSKVRLSMFPDVPSGISEPYARRKNTTGAKYSGNPPAGWSEELLPTPPVTPGWFAQMFDTSADERVCVEAERTGLMQLGSLARTRRRRHVQNTPSSSSNEESSDGTIEPSAPLSASGGPGWRPATLIDQKHIGRKF